MESNEKETPMADKKMSAAEKAEVQQRLEYAQKCHDNTSDATARNHWAGVIQACHRVLGAD